MKVDGSQQTFQKRKGNRSDYKNLRECLSLVTTLEAVFLGKYKKCNNSWDDSCKEPQPTSGKC